MTQRCQYELKQAWLGQEFGENFAKQIFGAPAIEALPRYAKGKNAGKHKASIEWIKVTVGGWDRDRSRVENRVGSRIAARLVIRPFRGPVETIATDGEAVLFSRWQ